MLPLIAIETLLIFPVIFVKKIIDPSTSVPPDSSASVAATALHECRSFGMRRPLHNCLAVFVKEVQGMLEVLWVPVVPGGEIVL